MSSSLLFRLIPLLLLPGLLSACAAKQETALQATASGTLPQSGTVAVRSGLAWMPENTPMFARFASSLTPMLTAHGLSPIRTAPSRSAPLPPGFDGAPAAASQADEGRRSRNEAARGNAGRVHLSPYTIPEHDADLPPSVLAVRGVDLRGILFAGSQLSGLPQWRGAPPLPGYMPAEVRSTDPQHADYALLCRFAVLRPQRVAAAPVPERAATLAAGERSVSDKAVLVAMADAPGTLLAAAAPIRGVGSLGYGSRAPATPPRPSYGGTPGDYRRGYEGHSPGDPWNREADLKARNFEQRYSAPPAYASPPASASVPPQTPPAALPSLPKPPLPGDADMPAGSPPAQSAPPAGTTGAPSGDGAAGSPADTGDGSVYVLEMEMYALAPVRDGKEPAPVWRASVLRQSDAAGPAAALPEMAASALGAGR